MSSGFGVDNEDYTVGEACKSLYDIAFTWKYKKCLIAYLERLDLTVSMTDLNYEKKIYLLN